jgi:hypothetical protein
MALYTIGPYHLSSNGRWYDSSGATAGGGPKEAALNAQYIDATRPNLAKAEGISGNVALYNGKLYEVSNGKANLNRPYLGGDTSLSTYQMAMQSAKGMTPDQMQASREAGWNARSAENEAAYDRAAAIAKNQNMTDTEKAAFTKMTLAEAGVTPESYAAKIGNVPLVNGVAQAIRQVSYSESKTSYTPPPKNVWTPGQLSASDRASFSSQATLFDQEALSRSTGIPLPTIQANWGMYSQNLGSKSYSASAAFGVSKLEKEGKAYVPGFGSYLLKPVEIGIPQLPEVVKTPKPKADKSTKEGLTLNEIRMVYGTPATHEKQADFYKRIGVMEIKTPVTVIEYSNPLKPTKSVEYESMLVSIPKPTPPPALQSGVMRELDIGTPAPPGTLRSSYSGSQEIPGNLKAFVSETSRPLNWEFNEELDVQYGKWAQQNYEYNKGQYGYLAGGFLSAPKEIVVGAGLDVAKFGLAVGVALPAAAKIVEIRGKQMTGQSVSLQEESYLPSLSREVLGGTTVGIAEPGKYVVLGKLVSGAGWIGSKTGGALIKLPIISSVAEPVVKASSTYAGKVFGTEFGKYAGESTLVLVGSALGSVKPAKGGGYEINPGAGLGTGVTLIGGIWAGKELPKLGAKAMEKMGLSSIDPLTKTVYMSPEEAQARESMGLQTRKQTLKGTVKGEAETAFRTAQESRAISSKLEKIYAEGVMENAPFGKGGAYNAVGFDKGQDYSSTIAKLKTMGPAGAGVASSLESENAARTMKYPLVSETLAGIKGESAWYSTQANRAQARFEFLAKPTIDPVVSEAARSSAIQSAMKGGLLNAENVGTPLGAARQASVYKMMQVRTPVTLSITPVPKFVTSTKSAPASVASAPIKLSPPMVIPKASFKPSSSTASVFSKALVESAKSSLLVKQPAYQQSKSKAAFTITEGATQVSMAKMMDTAFSQIHAPLTARSVLQESTTTQVRGQAQAQIQSQIQQQFQSSIKAQVQVRGQTQMKAQSQLQVQQQFKIPAMLNIGSSERYAKPKFEMMKIVIPKGRYNPSFVSGVFNIQAKGKAPKELSKEFTIRPIYTGSKSGGFKDLSKGLGLKSFKLKGFGKKK